MWPWSPFLLTIVATVFCLTALYAAICCMVSHQDRAGLLLKERLARGEITEAQYKEQSRLLAS